MDPYSRDIDPLNSKVPFRRARQLADRPCRVAGCRLVRHSMQVLRGKFTHSTPLGFKP